MTSPETLELEAVDAALAGRYVAPEHAELAELALLLRDDRPEPRSGWVTQLDRRVEARFPARPKPRRQWVWLRKAAPVLAVAAVFASIFTAAVLNGGSGDDAGSVSSSGGGGMSSDSAGSAESSGAMAAPSVRSPGPDSVRQRKVQL